MQRVPFIVLVTMIVLLSPVLTSAQRAYGFSWGVSVGQEIAYTIEIIQVGSDSPTQTYREDVIVTIKELGDLSELTPNAFPSPAATSILYANGTELTYEDPVYVTGHMILVFPIGNWSFYRELVENVQLPEDSSQKVEFFEDLFIWSLDNDISFGDTYLNTTYQFSKSDGALHTFNSFSYYEYVIDTEVLFTQTVTTTITRTGFGVFDTIPMISTVTELLPCGIIRSDGICT